MDIGVGVAGCSNKGSGGGAAENYSRNAGLMSVGDQSKMNNAGKCLVGMDARVSFNTCSILSAKNGGMGLFWKGFDEMSSYGGI